VARKIIGAVLLLLGLVAAYLASIHREDQTRTIIEVSIAIVLGGIGTRLLFRTED
jgi:arginine exporter protein ArgO